MHQRVAVPALLGFTTRYELQSRTIAQQFEEGVVVNDERLCRVERYGQFAINGRVREVRRVEWVLDERSGEDGETLERVPLLDETDQRF